MAYLIRGAIFRPRYQSNETGRFSLNIRPLGELVDMYHTRKATDPLDRIYALIGMSSDDPIASGLNIDYNAKWTDVFHKCVKLALPDQMSVSTWDDTDVAMIEGKGYMLGVVSSVETDSTRDDRQHLEITWQKSLHYKAAEGESLRCTLHVSAKPVQVGDAVCHLEGALSPTIIRPNQGFFTVIIIAASLAGNQPEWTKNIKTFPNQLLLIWDWGAYSRTGRDYGLNSRGVKCSRAGCLCQDHLGKAIRLWEFGISLAAMNLSQRSGIALRHALEACKTGMALRDVEDVASGHHPANKAGKEVLQMMSGILETGKAALLEENYESYGQTPLEWAAEEGHDAVVKLLLDNGTAVNATNRNGQTPLHVVANRGRQAMVQLLLDRGANMGTADQDGQLPLHIAAREGHEAVVELLLNRGADINSVSRDDQSPLFWAALNGHEPVVALLLDRGAAIHNHYYLGEGIRAIDAAYAAGTIPLNAAVKQGHKGVAKLLLDKGTYSHTPDKLGYTALYLAISNGDEALVKLLLERYADTSGSMNLVPLCQAASKGYVRIVELLLDAGAYIEERNYLDNSPLDVAAERGHDQVVKLLLKRRAIISEGNPLKLAASNGHEEIVKLLLDSGVGVDATNWSGETSLHLAASNGREMMVELLLDRGAAINAEDEYGETALQKAAWKGHEVVVNLLLDKGAAIDSQNKDGETALQKAAWKGHEAVVELLRSRGARDKKNRR
jgi:ankyrin repeat protein